MYVCMLCESERERGSERGEVEKERERERERRMCDDPACMHIRNDLQSVLKTCLDIRYVYVRMCAKHDV